MLMTYQDGRPFAKIRIEADDEGIVLRHGTLDEDGYGIREPLVFFHEGTYFLHYDASDQTHGWSCYLATSVDLINWTKVGRILSPATKPGELNYEYDRSGAVYNYPYYEDGVWHGFYIGSNFAYRNRHDVPEFPYLTLKTSASSPYGPWKKEPIIPFTIKPGTYYETTASSGQVVKVGKQYLQFFSASVDYPHLKQIKRTISIARTNDLYGTWQIDAQPILPPEEQIENSALYYQAETETWFLFTNHVGILEGNELTDAVWMYWTQDIERWNAEDKAIIIDGKNCTWSKKIIGAPSVIEVNGKLHIFYDGIEDDRVSHYHRHIGKCSLALPIQIPKSNFYGHS
jgi:predicted GH43/DUF377 family glycosyl hydrolase